MTTEPMDNGITDWEDGTLGADERFVQVHEMTKEEHAAINKAVGLTPVEILLENEVISECERRASLRGIGLKTYLRAAIKSVIFQESTYATYVKTPVEQPDGL